MTALNNISLYIPHVFPNFDKEFLTKKIEHLGSIDHIDMVSRLDRDGKPYNSVYIHFKSWSVDSEARKFHAKVLDPKADAHLYYDRPWYWIVLPNTAKKQVSGDRKPNIDLGGSNSICIKTPEKPFTFDEPIPILKLKRQTNANCLVPTKLQFDEDPLELLINLCDKTNAEIDIDFDSYIKMLQDEEDNMDEIDSYLAQEQEQEQEQQEEVPDEIDEILNEMDEVEDIMDSVQDTYLANYDSRYVRDLEQENSYMRMQMDFVKRYLSGQQVMYQW
jgi:hypothetical protein